MKWRSKSAVLLLGSCLYFSPSLSQAQEKNSPSPKASDIQDTSPASLSEQKSENTYSNQDLCQISKKLSNTAQSSPQRNSGSSSVLLDSPDNGRFRKGFPLTKVLGSLSENDNQDNSKPLKPKPKSNRCN
ncbi:hypothetical protein [Acaryochloris marina]|uniref:hypothetical protein n=1 Tax=Acaryochloris marina TaxID=155978 RepID=UPI001BAFB5FB|nr:hypothetical protein [Acaryochloris marina]QUY44631.1 hypothetical protein I1H34_11390 [Acaryochloris marina S15]